jgi:cytochrome b
MERASVRVWDPFIRVFHWSLVVSIAVAWFTGDGWKALHLWAGYAAASLIALRIVYGFIGPANARFSSFVPRPSTLVGYVRDMIAGREARHLGHNPAGGAMIVALIVTLSSLCLTGWLQTTDLFWGDEWLEEVHEALANGLLVLVALHVGGVILASLRHRENLVAAMVTGRKKA